MITNNKHRNLYKGVSTFSGALMLKVRGENITFFVNETKEFSLTDEEFKNLKYSKKYLTFFKTDQSESNPEKGTNETKAEEAEKLAEAEKAKEEAEKAKEEAEKLAETEAEEAEKAKEAEEKAKEEAEKLAEAEAEAKEVETETKPAPKKAPVKRGRKKAVKIETEENE